MISPGNLSDMTMEPALTETAAGRFDRLIAKGYDSNAIRAAIQAQGAEFVISSNRSRKALSRMTAMPIARVASSNASGTASRTGGASPLDTKSSSKLHAGVFLAAAITFWRN
jgi:hypothetical protein